MQRLYLKERGTLDFFVKCIDLGQTELAKWCLLKTGKPEIVKIVKKNSVLPHDVASPKGSPF